MFYIPYFNETNQECDQNRFRTSEEAAQFARENGYGKFYHDNGETFWV
jgi:lipoate-protein ligase A